MIRESISQRKIVSQFQCRLAAVDMHTAQHLVSNCLMGDLARNRTIILATHHIGLCLSSASYLVELSQGTVLREGSIQELQALNLLQTVIETEDEPFSHDDNAKTPDNEADVLDTTRKSRSSNGKLIEEESRAEGRVSWRTYLTYARASGLFSWLLTITLMLLIRFINIGNQVCHRDNNLAWR